MEWSQKHKNFFAAGKRYKKRVVIADNRTGKTSMVSQEIYYHVTKDYPEDWGGIKFDKPIKVWVISATHLQNRETTQKELSRLLDGVGHSITWRLGVLIGALCFKLLDGTVIEFKSTKGDLLDYQGSQPDFIWLDDAVYSPHYRLVLMGCESRNPRQLVETYTTRGVYTDVIKWEDVDHLGKEAVRQFTEAGLNERVD
jgi:hypothetical protein